MGWVTLTLRKTELKRSHSDYQSELLQISREKRQMARQSHYEQMLVRNDQQADLRSLKDTYDAQREILNNTLSQAQQSGGSVNTTGQGVQTTTQIQNALDELREDYAFAQNEIKSQYEEELEMLEQEATDKETDLDQQQVEVEAQLEAISAELEAVGEAISSQIQSSTIKLS